MKILLLNPPKRDNEDNIHVDAVISRHTGTRIKTNYILPPLGLLQIGALLKREGFFPDVIDSMVEGKSYAQIKDKAEKYDVVFCTVATSTCEANYDFLKNLNVKHKVVMGTHATYFWKDILEKKYADFVLVGEPDLTAVNLVKALNGDFKYDFIDGLAYIKDDKPVKNKTRELIKDLDSLPFPDRSLIDNSKYFVSFFPGDRFTILLTSRGCPFECTFCATHLHYGRYWRARSAKNVVDEIKKIVNTYKIKRLGFWDDTFTIDRKRVREICNLILENNLNIKWICLARVDSVDLKTLRLMKKAGCMQIQYGVESGSQEVLNNVKKGITLEQVREAVKWTKEAGIEQILFFMIGNPGDTEETVKNTIEFAKELDPDYVSFNIATPYPGSEMYEEIKQKNYDWKDFDTLCASVPMCDLSKDYLNKIVKKAYREFYFRPSYILKTTKKIVKRPKTMFPMMKAGFETLRMIFK